MCPLQFQRLRNRQRWTVRVTVYRNDEVIYAAGGEQWDGGTPPVWAK
jgi:hypothetical protein